MFPDIELFRIQHKCTLSNMYKKYAVLQHIYKLWKKITILSYTTMVIDDKHKTFDACFRNVHIF